MSSNKGIREDQEEEIMVAGCLGSRGRGMGRRVEVDRRRQDGGDENGFILESERRRLFVGSYLIL